MKHVKVVIPSRERPEVLAKNSAKLFPEATICVGEAERGIYTADLPGFEIVTHPDDVRGIGPLKQWILDAFPNDRLVIADDDIKTVYTLAGLNKREIPHPQDVQLILDNAAQAAIDAGTVTFGFNQAWDVRKFRPQNPFMFNAWVGSVVGYIGREIRYDPKLRLRADIDYCLQTMMRYRIVWQDARFSFIVNRSRMTGGNSASRSAARDKKEREYLKKKWGAYVSFRKTKTTIRMLTQVNRTWPVAG